MGSRRVSKDHLRYGPSIASGARTVTRGKLGRLSGGLASRWVGDSSQEALVGARTMCRVSRAASHSKVMIHR